jgi:hypothetical protein
MQYHPGIEGNVHQIAKICARFVYARRVRTVFGTSKRSVSMCLSAFFILDEPAAAAERGTVIRL